MRKTGLVALLLLAGASAQALNVSTNSPAAWEQSTDDGLTWVAADVADGWTISWTGETVSGIWPVGVEEGPTVLFRSSFTLPAAASTATLYVAVDDDAMVYVNGHLVFTDDNQVFSESLPIDVAPYLTAGTNTITAAASSYYCCGRTFVLSADIQPIPEPATYAMMLAGLAIVGALARRRPAA